MAEFAWNARERGEPEGGGAAAGKPKEEGGSILQRWVERSDGRFELVDLPLTPELFLNPELDDRMVQGQPHGDAVHDLYTQLRHHFRREPDVLLLYDVQLLLGRGLPSPVPDLSMVRGVRDLGGKRKRYRVAKHGVPPCLVVEVVSPDEASLRRVDEADKVDLYARAGIQEYLLVDLPRQANQNRHRLQLYRLGSPGRYEPVEPDEQGRLRSETTGLSFAVSPEGDRIELYDGDGNRLLTRAEEAELREAAEEKARREAKARRKAERARKVAEAELARLRAEVERREWGGTG